MSYYEKLEESIKRMKEFDNQISVKIVELQETLKEIDFKGMIESDDNKQVTAHKNRTLRVVNRVIDKFEREIETYLLPLINVDVKNNEEEVKE